MKSFLTFFLLLTGAVLGQTTQRFVNIQLTATPTESVAASVTNFLQLDAAGIGEKVSPTTLWSAVVLTGTVDTADIADGTTLGRNLFKLANPSAVTFPRFNADNTVTARTAAELKTDLSLNNVDNTADTAKPVSTAQQTALNLKANIASPTFTGIVAEQVTTPATLAAAATTFAVTSNIATVTGDGGGNTVATITGGVAGMTLTLVFTDANITITDTDAATANTVNLSAAFTSSANDTMQLLYTGGKWLELRRSVN